MRGVVRPGTVAWVVLGGTVGTAVRDALEAAFGARGEVPWATLAINVSGALLLGLLLEWLLHAGPDEGGRRTARLAVGTGVLGGYTTYSTFVLESVSLAGAGQGWLALGYDALSLGMGFLAALCGVALGRRLGGGRPA